jgi:hypothetical protein
MSQKIWIFIDTTVRNNELWNLFHIFDMKCSRRTASVIIEIVSLKCCRTEIKHESQYNMDLIHSFISIQPLRPCWQEPKPIHVTGMALAHCILSKFLGVGCHCFPPPLDVPTFAARCLYVGNDVRDPSSERWNFGREICPVILPKFRLPRKFRDLLHPANLRHGADGFTSLPKEGVLRGFS